MHCGTSLCNMDASYCGDFLKLDKPWSAWWFGKIFKCWILFICIILRQVWIYEIFMFGIFTLKDKIDHGQRFDIFCAVGLQMSRVWCAVKFKFNFSGQFEIL